MASYTRQSTFSDGDLITAELFNDEYNQLLAAFENTTGHKHDGTVGEGPVISIIGDAGLATPLNKILIDTTNDHIEFWVDVSGTSTQQLYITDGAILPVTDNDIDLGSNSLQFKDLYINGTANIDTVDIDAGTIDGVTIGGNSAGAITGTTITATNFVIGSASINETELEILDGATLTTTELNYVDGVTSSIQTQIDTKAPLASPSLTGIPTAPTAASNTNTTQIATTAYVQSELTDLIDGAPGTLDTLNELAAAINDDANYNTTLTTALATKLPLAGGTMTGNVTYSDNVKAQFGTSQDLQIYHNGSNSFIDDTGTGSLFIRADATIEFKSLAQDEYYIKCVENDTVQLYNNGSVKLATTSTGIDVTGTTATDGLNVSGAGTIINSGVNSGTALTVKGESGNGLKTQYIFESGTNQYNWQLGFATHASQTFSITPSTAANGTTFSNPVLNINQSGAATFTGNVTLSSTAPLLYLTNTTSGTGKAWRFSSASNGKLFITQEGVIDAVTLDHTTGNATFAGAITTDALSIDSTISGSSFTSLAFKRSGTNKWRIIQQSNDSHLLFYNDINGINQLSLKADGNVGIGIVSPGAKLHVNSGASDVAAIFESTDDYADIRLKDNSGSSHIRNAGGNLFLQADRENAVANTSIRFSVDSSEKSRIDSSGNLLVGTTSTNPQDGDHGFVVRANGYTLTSVDNARAMLVNRASSDGDIISLAKAGTIFGNIGVIHGNNLFIGGTSHSGLQFGGSIIYPTGGTGSANDATVDLGGSATRFKNLHLSGNAYIGSSAYAQYFGSSADTNTLIQFAGSDDIRFRAGGTEQMRIKTTGVGINTTSPSSALEVNNVSAGATVATFEGNYSGSGDVKLASFERVGGAVAAAMEYNDATTDMEFGTTTSHNFSLKTADTRRLTISSGGNVGIGTASPSHKLDIAAGDIGLDSGRTLYLGSDSNVSINSTSSSRVMRFYTGGSERARINSSGHLLVGTTNSSNTVTGFRAYSGGNIGIAINGQSAEFNRLNNNGNILEFKKDGTNIGYIGSEGGNTLYIVNDDTGIRFAGGSDVIVPCGASGASSDNLISLGLSVLRFKDLHLGGTANVGETLSMSHTGNTSTITLTQKAGTQNSVATISANREDTSSSASRLLFSTNNGTSTLQRIRINNGGDISFYEDTGTTQAFFWDASSESLGIGDTAPQDYLEINGSGKGLGGLTISNSTHNHAALSFARSSTATARIYLNEPDATHTGQLNFQTSNASGGSPNLVTAMVIDENQRVGIGTTAPTSPLHVSGAAKVTGTITVGASHTLGDVGQTDDFIIQSSENNNLILKAGVDSDSLILKTTNTALTINPEGKITIEEETTIDDDINLSLSGSVKGKVGVSGSQGDDIYIASGATSSAGFGLRFIDYNVTEAALPCRGDGSTADNLMDLGNSGSRFDDIYATNGTINTSDKNEKQDIQALTEAEQRVATACKGLIRRFRWQDAVEKKGDDARYHFGVIAQDLQDAFEAEGLDAGDYGMFISSTWTDDEGNEQTRLGVRYNELLAFIITTL